MGTVFVEVAGSFEQAGKLVVCAENGGHTLALQRAISFLQNKIPGAIRQDHALHDKGDRPPKSDFGEFPEHEPQGLREP